MTTDRMSLVVSLIADYLRSPSLRHLRDPYQIQRLAREIVEAVDRGGSIWTKWAGGREDVVRAAAPCWVPEADLLAFLNRLPGPELTATDLAQRLRAIWEEPWSLYPDEDLSDGCLALYERETAQGTEMAAIVGALQDHVAAERERLRREQEERHRLRREEDRERARHRLLSGADCGWTAMERSDELYCRRNGRTFRIARGADKRWKLYRVADVGDEGVLLGAYLVRGEANKVLEKLAYQPEPRW